MERHVGGAIHQLHNLMCRDNNRFPHEEMIENLTASHGYVLGWLCAHQGEDGVFQRDVERQLLLRRSSATGVLQTMERGGLIRRVPVPQDARLKKLVVTQKGRELYALIYSDILETERRLTAGLSEQELAAFWQVLDKLRDNLERGLYTDAERQAPKNPV